MYTHSIVHFLPSCDFHRVVSRVNRDKVQTYPADMPFGNLLVRYVGNSLIARTKNSNKDLWKFDDPDDLLPNIFAFDDRYLYIASIGGNSLEFADTKAVWVVDTRTGKIGSRLNFPQLKAPWLVQSVSAILPGPNGIAVLTSARQSREQYDQKAGQGFLTSSPWIIASCFGRKLATRWQIRNIRSIHS